MFAAWGVSDWVFGNRTKGHNEELRQRFLAELEHQQKHKANDDTTDDCCDLSSLDAKPTVFYCVVRKSTGLTHCLTGAQLGDVVEVLEEGVGPDRAYNLCRLPVKEKPGQPSMSLSRDAYGWFPIRWLQKMEHYESMVQKQLVHLAKKNQE